MSISVKYRSQLIVDCLVKHSIGSFRMNGINGTEFASWNEIRPFGYYLVPSLLVLMLVPVAKLINAPAQLFVLLVGMIIGSVRSVLMIETNLLCHPNYALAIYIPLLIIKITYTLDVYILSKSVGQILCITVFGTSIHMLVLGLTIQIFKGNPLSPIYMILSAAFLTPNDVPILPDLGAIKNLEILMCGESVFSTAISLMTIQILLGSHEQYVTHWYQFVALYCRSIGGSIIVGLLSGQVCLLWFRHLYDDSYNAIAAVFAVSYLVYNFSEYVLCCSGPIAAFITVFFIAKERPRLLGSVDRDIIIMINSIYHFVQLFFLTIYSNIIIQTMGFHSFHQFFDVILAVGAYILGNIFRLLLFLMMSPVLSRIGYGFDFPSLITIFWAVQKGPYPLIMSMYLYLDPVVEYLGPAYLIYTLVYVFLSHLINGTTLMLFIHRFRLAQFSTRCKNNISNAISALNENANRLLAIMKLNRFYSDANWPLIHSMTVLNDPFKDYGFNRSIWAKQTVVCNVCGALIALEPSKEEYNEFGRDVSLKVLKAQKVSIMKQFEMGILNKMELRTLLQAIEVAMDSQDLILKVDELVAMIRDKTSYGTRMRKILKKFAIDSSVKIPKGGIRKLCYFVATSFQFELILHAAISINLIVLCVQLATKFDNSIGCIVIVIIDALCNVVFITEVAIKITGYSHTSYKEGCRIYLKNHWNKFDVLILVLNIGDITFSVIKVAAHPYFSYSAYRYVKAMRFISLLKLLKLFGRIYPRFLLYWERKKDLKVMHAYVVAKTLMVSYEDVLDLVPALTDNANVRDAFKTKLIVDKVLISKELGILEKEKPALTTTAKTTQAMRSIIRFMREGADELLSSGLIDSFEYNELTNALNERQKNVETFITMDVNQPKEIFNEVQWLDEPEMREFLYENVKTKIWNVGDVIYRQGDMPDGVFILSAGVFKMTYCPTAEVVENMKTLGMLPVKEYLQYMRFTEVQDDYFMVGTSMGELALLTQRPYSCSIVADAPSQAFIIPCDILREAFAMDPVLGLEAKIWKCVTMGLVRKLLMKFGPYQSMSFEEISIILSRAVMPNLDYYKIMEVGDFVEDLILVEGVVVDYTTREIFIAPCCLPRTVTKLIMPQSSLFNLKVPPTKLMIVPAHDIDEYEMMLAIERGSKLVNNQRKLKEQNRAKPRKKVATAFTIHYHVGSAKNYAAKSIYEHRKKVLRSKNTDSFTLDSKKSNTEISWTTN